MSDDHALARRNRLMKKYGITPQQYDSMFEWQNGQCAICDSPPRALRLSVDHDHGTDSRGIKHRVRGLLCHVCNRYRVGMNSLETARRVLAYLESTLDGRNIL
jgi:hypothetical protein